MQIDSQDLHNPNFQETHFALHAYDGKLLHFCTLIKSQLVKLLRRASIFFLLYLGFVLTQLVLTIIFLTTYFVGIFITSFFVSLFLTFPYLYYLKAKKAKRMHFLIEEFEKMCRGQVHSFEDEKENNFILSYGTKLLYDKMLSIETYIFRMPKWLFFFQDFFSLLSQVLHKHDLFYLKELLLEKSKLYRIKLIQKDPQNPKYHIKLALGLLDMHAFYQTYTLDRLEKKYMLLAIQELKIVHAYLPNNMWTLEQLAICYSELKDTKREAKVLEKLVQIEPENVELLKNLGTLYFQMGRNKKGLEMYENLSAKSIDLAQEMLTFFGGIND